MAGLTDLDTLVATMRPKRIAGTFVFVTVPGARYGDSADLEPIAAFCETEGLTLVVPEARAIAAGFGYDGVFAGLTLSVQSSLSAVGLTAVVARTLAGCGIPANVIAAFHHDHVFVPDDRAAEALAALERAALRHGAPSRTPHRHPRRGG